MNDDNKESLGLQRCVKQTVNHKKFNKILIAIIVIQAMIILMLQIKIKVIENNPIYVDRDWNVGQQEQVDPKVNTANIIDYERIEEIVKRNREEINYERIADIIKDNEKMSYEVNEDLENEVDKNKPAEGVGEKVEEATHFLGNEFKKIIRNLDERLNEQKRP